MRKEFETLATLARAQGGVVTRQQALANGASYEAQRLRIRSGLWQERFGCIAIGATEFSPDWIDASALTLRYGRDTVITGPTALRVCRIPISSPLVLAVVASGHHSVTAAKLLRDTSPRSVSRNRHFTHALVPDALVDTMCVLPERQAMVLLDEALQRHWISVNRLEGIIERRRGRGRHGIRTLEKLHQRIKSGSRSEAERRMLPLLRRVPGVRWRANYPILLNGQVIAEADFAAPELKLCIEIDGRAYHSDRAAFENDRTRQNALVLAGWTVLRFTWEQITKHPEAVVAAVVLAVAQRAS